MRPPSPLRDAGIYVYSNWKTVPNRFWTHFGSQWKTVPSPPKTLNVWKSSRFKSDQFETDTQIHLLRQLRICVSEENKEERRSGDSGVGVAGLGGFIARGFNREGIGYCDLYAIQAYIQAKKNKFFLVQKSFFGLRKFFYFFFFLQFFFFYNECEPNSLNPAKFF